jgi:hypothetical protein
VFLKLITTYRLQRFFGAGIIAGINIATFITIYQQQEKT